jgi:hypothetical protein
MPNPPAKLGKILEDKMNCGMKSFHNQSAQAKFKNDLLSIGGSLKVTRKFSSKEEKAAFANFLASKNSLSGGVLIFDKDFKKLTK